MSSKDLSRVFSEYFATTPSDTWSFEEYFEFVNTELDNKPVPDDILESSYEEYLFKYLKESKVSKSLCETYLLNRLKKSKISTGVYIAKIEEIRNINTALSEISDDALRISAAYNNLVAGNNIIPFVELLKNHLSTRSPRSLSWADEVMLQAIVEALLPSRRRVPELCLLMDSSKEQRESGLHDGFADIFVLGGTEGNNVCLELKYISLPNLLMGENGYEVRDPKKLKKLDEKLETEDKKSLLERRYAYKRKGHIVLMTVRKRMNDGLDQLRGYMNAIVNGRVSDDPTTPGVLDERVKPTELDRNKLKGFLIMVIGFRRILWCEDNNQLQSDSLSAR